MKRRMDSANG
jgi:hypothetical protein